ncbi:glycoside hydrolase N-terminal domain-containing protein, partial [Bacteroidales bacterium OttesenSCG-928-A17]|nr:glycoside hydrolase N-terminal domain-containing protein [Bacteroidales bacterium OttesenSCG-928-A17]
LWSGGPGKNPAYNGGHARTAEENRQNLQKARRVLQDKMSAFAQNNSAYIDNKGNLITSDYSPEDEELRAYIKGLMGDRADFGSYQSLGHIHITDLNEKPDTSSVKNYSAYQRSLDIDHAIASVSYMKDEVVFSREYFMTYPRNVMLIRYSADKPGSISRAIRVSSPQALADISLQDNVITLTGRPADHHENGLKFAQQLKVIPTGGSLKIEGDKIIVENADEFLILMSASTNYMMCMDNSFNYFSDKDPLFTVKSNLQKASGLSYRTLKSEHVKDYKSLYDNLTLSLGEYTQIPSKTTDCLLKEYGKTNTEEEDRYLEMLYYQFGRYLLISSSRENTLPANLQGIWADGLTPPWNSDYHTNINLQMNYWLAQQANLSDCHLPVIEYVKSLVPRGRETAQFYYCKEDGSDVRGWVIHHENNIWGNTAPGSWYTAFHFPTAAAWCCQDIWEYYQFNQDEKFLKENYDILLDAALFWVDNLWTDERDGKLVTNPAYSPEHGYYSIGTSADQAIITELFDFVIKASDVLGRNGSEIEEIRTAKNKLSGPKIGLGGQFMEWKDETAMDLTGDNHHRHVNHLHWLHPGSQIVPGRSEQEDSYVEAMKKTLLTRGDGGTGWSKAWKINFWARLRDGDHAYKMVSEILKESTLTNLFDTHPPFQIDGNFGATAGMTEMLLQSQGDCIEILPALPQAWNTGSFNGIKARGNFTLSADWKDAALKTLEIVSNSGNKCVVKYPGISTMRLKEQNGRNVDVKTINENVISFSTQKGKSYFFSVE